MLKAKNALLTLVMHVLHLWLAKELPSNDWQKTFVGKNAYLFVMYTIAL
jgi:hypothetical protein